MKTLKESNVLSLEARKDFIFALRHLQITDRWKENPTYRKSSFKKFLLNRYNMKYKTFRKELRAFGKYEKEIFKYGLGTVLKIIKKGRKAPHIFDTIQKAELKLIKPIRADRIETIIKTF